ncbi:hypothetical protein D9619_002731 [Psilocybe cf. subviscida]|uniref:Uncharacterized protein n=1 Tax=Psilocybe cf. subviscida TaxID=2480587 RepID=A0A8H5EUE5_9AGAR|nr:hypothetical protein D9619_002731 [Psilocybe cf. subviscida]
MSGIGNWRKRVHKRSMSESKLDKQFWSFTPSPLGSKNHDTDSIGSTARHDSEADAMDGPKKIEGATIIFHSDATNSSTNAPTDAALDDNHDMLPIDEPPPPPPKSRKIVQDPYALLEEEERAERLLKSNATPQPVSTNTSVTAWSRMHDLGYADFQGFILGPINEREQDENRLIALPPPPRYKKNAPTKVQPTKRRPRLRQASSLPNSPTFTGDNKNIGTSHQEDDETPTKKIPGDSISRIEIGIVSDGQRPGKGLTDGISLRLDENSRLGPGVAGGLDWPLAWQWSPIGSINLEAGNEAEMGQVDSAPDSSSSRKEQLHSTNQEQAPPTSLAASLSLPLSLPSPPSPTLFPNSDSWTDLGGGDKVEEEDKFDREENLDGSTMLKDGQRGWQRRPLLSHGTSASISSQGSSIATDDGPASTVENEPRISISSTVYEASSNDHSHSHSLYHTPMPVIMSDRDSFMDLQSPMHHEFHYNQPSPEPVSPISFAHSPHSPDLDFGFPRPPKPPVPTTPKPHFHRPHSRQSSPMAETPPHSGGGGDRKKKKSVEQKTLPPTTNFLDIDERADLVRKSRKLARVFGETPGADAFAQDAWRPAGKPLHLGGSSSSRRHSMPLSPEDVSFLSILSPTFDPSKKEKKGKKSAKDKERSTSKDRALKKALPSPTSFIDLSDEENAPSVAATKPRLHANVRGLPPFASAPTSPLSERTGASVLSLRPPSPTQSLVSTFTVDTVMPDPEEEDRRRKRERLAKLHRFLGSRVPANLVLGFDEREDEATLPAPLDTLSPLSLSLANDGANDESPNSGKGIKPAWMKRRRSSSAGLLPPLRVGDPSIHTPFDRQCEELDDKEKAINVRRAHKMEQVFGVAPPQTLFHTRQAASSSPAIISPPFNIPKGSSKKSSGPSSAPLIALPPIPSMSVFPDVLLIQRSTNINRSSYNSRKSSKKRPGSADSKESGRQTLLPGPSEVGHGSSFDEREFGKHGPGNDAGGNTNLSPQVQHSFIYNHYQHSLNSLNDILDRDDRESLAELHDYLNSTNFTNTTNADPTSPSPTPKADGQFTTQQQETHEQQQQLKARDRSASIASSLKSNRRRSLPSRTSMISLSPSEFSVSSISSISTSYTVQQANEFQQRRRRAAKLAQFFGVNYRELVNEVLESIESGVAQEQLRGTLKADEVEDLLTKLRTLKVKRSRLF